MGGGSSDWALAGAAVEGGAKTDRRCMERYLDDFMGRYGHTLPPYIMVPHLLREGGGEADAVEGSDAAPSPGASERANAEGEEGAAGIRKRPRLSAAFSRLVEDKSLGLGFRRTEFRAMPTEGLDEFAGLWPHPYLPPAR